jgi:hypothetical protein
MHLWEKHDRTWLRLVKDNWVPYKDESEFDIDEPELPGFNRPSTDCDFACMGDKDDMA